MSNNDNVATPAGFLLYWNHYLVTPAAPESIIHCTQFINFLWAKYEVNSILYLLYSVIIYAKTKACLASAACQNSWYPAMLLIITNAVLLYVIIRQLLNGIQIWMCWDVVIHWFTSAKIIMIISFWNLTHYPFHHSITFFHHLITFFHHLITSGNKALS